MTKRSKDPNQLTLDFDLLFPKYVRRNPLRKGGVRTALDARRKTDEELLGMKGVGPKTVRASRDLERS